MIAHANGIPCGEKEVNASYANREHMRAGNNSAADPDLPKHRMHDRMSCVSR